MGSYSCICPLGYRLDQSKKRCEDIDECAERSGVCEDGKCTNIPGGFTCTCPDGWITSRDGMNCIDQRREYCYNEIDRYVDSSVHIVRFQYFFEENRDIPPSFDPRGIIIIFKAVM
jgi:hypothetical protein